MKRTLPDYNNCIANLPNSILKNFCEQQGIPYALHENVSDCGNDNDSGNSNNCGKGSNDNDNRNDNDSVNIPPTLPALDTLLAGKQYKNIVVLLLDGMGQSIVERNLDPDGFFRTHLNTYYSSVFPPTTVAATTSIQCGLNPAQHAWLGWDCYYPQVNKNVTTFLNVEQGTNRPAANYNVAFKYTPYQSAVSKIKELGGLAYDVTPFAPPNPQTFPKICSLIEKHCKEPGQKYIYSYWNEPDHHMHQKGCYCQSTVDLVRRLEEQVKELAERLAEDSAKIRTESPNESPNESRSDTPSETLLIVTADHGHIESDGVSIEDYPEILDCLVRMPSIEPRALNLFVKEGREKEFETLFNKEFGGKFELWTKEEVIEKQLFGPGTEHENFRAMLGDYLAIAVDDLTIYNTREEARAIIGVHAGMTEDEMRIPLIAVEC